MKGFEIPKNLIVRGAYISRIKPFINKPIAKVLTGQRRVGKSYMLFQLMQLVLAENPDANIVYINKEDLVFDPVKDFRSLHQYITGHASETEMNYVFIDEIQEIAEFEKTIRSLLLKPNYDIYITGSNAKMLSGELATLLGGRTLEFTIYSLSYREFLDFHRLSDSAESFSGYMKYGGLPYLVNLKLQDDIVFEYLKNIYNSIIYRDIVARHHIRSNYFLEQLIRFMADNVGSLFSAKRISDYLKSQQVRMPHNQVHTFIGYLCDAFLISRVPRYDISGKRIFETGEKYYFENLGIRNSILAYRPGDQGKLLENMVYNQLLYMGYEVKTGWMDSREIDFVARREGELVYVQVALYIDSDKTIEREFGNLLKVKDNYPKQVITLDAEFKNSYNGIQHLSAREFLLQS